MIDTVTIKVPMDLLLPDAAPVDSQMIWKQLGWDMRTKHNYSTWFRNPTTTELQSSVHFPRLTGNREQKYNWRPMVKIEFSAPKLFWGNNVNELNDRDFLPVVLTLQQRLQEMGFNPSLLSLTQAVAIKVHYGKNFVLRNGYTAQGVIRDIRRISQSQRLIKTANEYPGQGTSINLHNKSFGLSIYDKRSEISAETLSQLARYGPFPEVLRIEARLEKLRVLNQMYEKLGFKSDPTFAEVFDAEKSRRIVTHYWQQLIRPQIALISDTDEAPVAIFERLLQLDPDQSVHGAIKMTSLIMMARSPGGLSDFRSALTHKMNPRSWYRLHAKLKDLSALLATSSKLTWWDQIEEQLAEFEALSIIKINQVI